MKLGSILFVVSVCILPLLYFFLDKPLFLVYLLVWIDKIILGLFRLFRYVGIETTALATVVAAMFYGPLFSFILILALFTVLQSVRYLIVPISVPEYPLFVPNPDSVIYASGGIIAAFALPLGLGATLLLVVASKYIVYILADLLLRKPPHLPALIGGMLFNAIVMIPTGFLLIGLTIPS